MRGLLCIVLFLYTIIFADFCQIYKYDGDDYASIGTGFGDVYFKAYKHNDSISHQYYSTYKDGVIRLVNKNGEMCYPIICSDIGDYSDDLIRVKLGDKWGYVDDRANIVIDFKYDYAYDFKEEVAIVSVGGKQNIIDKEGNYQFEKFYDNFNNQNGNFIIVRENGRYGVAHTGGRIEAEPIYDSVYVTYSYDIVEYNCVLDGRIVDCVEKYYK